MKDIFNETYKLGFEHGFLTAVVFDLQIKDYNNTSKMEGFLRQKKAAREWAISKGYLLTNVKKPNKKSSTKILSPVSKSFTVQRQDARDWAILMGYI